MKRVNGSLLGLAIVLCLCWSVRAQRPNAASEAAEHLVEQIRRNPAEPSTAAGRIGLYVIDVVSGEVTLAASEPEPWLCQCGSGAWSRDGKRIYFDATLGSGDFSLGRIKALSLNEGHLTVADIGLGNCPNPSPAGDRVIFLLNPGAVPGAQMGVWLMRADGSDRQRLEGYGRPRWSPDGHQFLIIPFGDPRQVTVIDDRPEGKSGLLQVPDRQIFSPPSWAGDGNIVAVLGEGAGDSVALIDVADPVEAKIKETLWKRGQDLDIKPLSPVYAPETGTCVFVGEQESKGLALYSIQRGKPGPPRRLEAEGFDHLLQSLSFAPGGRYVVFSSDRPDRRKPTFPYPGRKPSVEAPALSGITIDGDLKDWPPAMPRHTIAHMQSVPPRNGPGGLEHAFFATSPDLSAAFSVGYDPKEQVVYVAVIVRDDTLIVGNTSAWDTDSVKIYINGLHSDKVGTPQLDQEWLETFSAADTPVIHYIGLPGKGPVNGVRRSAGVERSGEDNPILMFGDIKKTKTKMAWRREGDVTTYEWTVQAFDHYPDQPTKLAPGMRIDFDVTVTDKDTPAQTPKAMNEPEADRAAWICWGPAIPPGSGKDMNAAGLGEIVLGREPKP
jgi:hypothetical protein